MKKESRVEKVVLDAIEEEYLDIYHKYFVLRWEWHEIAAYHNCSKSKVQTAIKWVIDNKLQFPSNELITGAIDAISSRLKRNQRLYELEAEKDKFRDNNFIVALSREIRDDEKTIFELQKLITPLTDENDNRLSAAQVLSLIKEVSKDSQ